MNTSEINKYINSFKCYSLGEIDANCNKCPMSAKNLQQLYKGETLNVVKTNCTKRFLNLLKRNTKLDLNISNLRFKDFSCTDRVVYLFNNNNYFKILDIE